MKSHTVFHIPEHYALEEEGCRKKYMAIVVPFYRHFYPHYRGQWVCSTLKMRSKALILGKCFKIQGKQEQHTLCMSLSSQFFHGSSHFNSRTVENNKTSILYSPTNLGSDIFSQQFNLEVRISKNWRSFQYIFAKNLSFFGPRISKSS